MGIVISGRKGKNYDDFAQIVNQNFLMDIFAQINFDIAPFIKLIDRNNLDLEKDDFSECFAITECDSAFLPAIPVLPAEG